MLLFPYVFWDNSLDHFGSVSAPLGEPGTPYKAENYERTRGDCYMFLNATEQAGVPVIVAFITGRSALELELATEDKVVRRCLEKLERIATHRGMPMPRPTATYMTRWGQDAFARGSYSYVAVGRTGDDYDVLARPIAHIKNPYNGRLFFAGEATCRNYPATVHGAFLSGLREATTIMNTLGFENDMSTYFYPDELIECPRLNCRARIASCFIVDHILKNHLSVDDRSV